ncbi:Alpha/Beta hydrolase protein [Collybia nuda]|uniref:Alpha/Beta hydrolase protein n=1 Tax=Collybia nuda TaxID=64659 RepID=A0A9P6CDU7_9AGAR|nr:Alpha/Beta hydrolase protein [Collybia nuda]
MSNSDSDGIPKPQQPLHPSVVATLDPEYVAFHNKYLQYVQPAHTRPWGPESRKPPPPGASPRTETDPLVVGRTQDWNVGHAKVRAYTPVGERPEGGWPVILFIPGGGWVYGGIENQASLSTNMCIRAKCVVVSLDHRLAPEDPYPAALEDAIDALKWLSENGSILLNVNTNKIAVGGCSSGGNLAAILALKATQLNPQIPLMFQLLLVPAVDNTASTDTFWNSNRHAPYFTPETVVYYRRLYLPNEQDWSLWQASPILAPRDLLNKAPKTWIMVAGADLLREEGERYGEILKDVGVSAEVKVYEGAPHAALVMDGTMQIGRTMITDAVNALAQAFEAVDNA